MTLAIAEHEIWWEETLVLDHCGGQKLDLREALHIQMTPAERSTLTRNENWNFWVAGGQQTPREEHCL